MIYKWIGATLVIAGCGSAGFSMATSYKKEEAALRELMTILEYLENELQYKLSSLPELCAKAAKECRGVLHHVFSALSLELESQMAPDACSCMSTTLDQFQDLPVSVRRLLLQLGHTLGRFDLPGQLRGIRSVQSRCAGEIKRFGKDRDIRLRSYQTLGLCAGTALAILFV